MTILNTSSDGFFNVLIVLHRTLAMHGAMDRKRLLRLCAPVADDESNRLSKTLLRWTQLGLFKKSDDGEYSLDKGDRNAERLPSICRRLLLSEANNQNFWDSEGTIAADFTRGVAFILAQDIYSAEFNSHPQVQELERRMIRDESRRILQNDTRWNFLQHWAYFLGFFWVDLRRWPDPTAAIRDELPRVFGDQTKLTSADFVSRLAENLPVLDGGRFRRMVEDALEPAEWHPPGNPKVLSTSLSRALWRLSQPGGPIRLDKRDDAGDSRTLQRAGGREWQTFTHALLGKGV